MLQKMLVQWASNGDKVVDKTSFATPVLPEFCSVLLNSVVDAWNLRLQEGKLKFDAWE